MRCMSLIYHVLGEIVMWKKWKVLLSIGSAIREGDSSPLDDKFQRWLRKSRLCDLTFVTYTGRACSLG